MVILLEERGGKVRRAWGPFENPQGLREFLEMVSQPKGRSLDQWEDLTTKIRRRASNNQYTFSIFEVLEPIRFSLLGRRCKKIEFR